MTKKKVKAEQRYLVLRTFGRDGKWKHVAGTLIEKADMPGEPIDRLIERGVIEVVDETK
jgi:hypothetical protein